MTYVPDSVLVEKVAKDAVYVAVRKHDSRLHPWEEQSEEIKQRSREIAEDVLRVACPLVAGVIADRLDERYAERSGDDSHSTMSDWDFARRDGLVDAAALVRSEFVDGEA